MTKVLAGKIAVVTGAASGIGLASSEIMMQAGATVVMVDRNAKALATLTKKWGDKAIAQVTDLLDSKSCAAMIPEILKKIGRIDIFHCNAGSYIGGELVETDADSIDRMLNLNVNAVIKNVHGVLPNMINKVEVTLLLPPRLLGGLQLSMNPSTQRQNLLSPVSLRRRVGR